jgi:hypothetical protein
VSIARNERERWWQEEARQPDNPRQRSSIKHTTRTRQSRWDQSAALNQDTLAGEAVRTATLAPVNSMRGRAAVVSEIAESRVTTAGCDCNY